MSLILSPLFLIGYGYIIFRLYICVNIYLF
nr:MAG TPA_asm: hypothetical protein [Caudoviricetes sp.]